MGRRTFTWRDQSYRLDSSTWHFWGRARLIQLPGDDGDFRMAPDDNLFVGFAVAAGFETDGDKDESETLIDCEVYLTENGHQVWSAREALQVVRDDTDTELATRLMDRLIYWFFLAPF